MPIYKVFREQRACLSTASVATNMSSVQTKTSFPIMSPRAFSIIRLKHDEDAVNPNERILNSNYPPTVANAVFGRALSLSLICQHPEVGSNLENHCLPPMHNIYEGEDYLIQLTVINTKPDTSILLTHRHHWATPGTSTFQENLPIQQIP